jgi:hypothetical protein
LIRLAMGTQIKRGKVAERQSLSVAAFLLILGSGFFSHKDPLSPAESLSLAKACFLMKVFAEDKPIFG